MTHVKLIVEKRRWMETRKDGGLGRVVVAGGWSWWQWRATRTRMEWLGDEGTSRGATCT